VIAFFGALFHTASTVPSIVGTEVAFTTIDVEQPDGAVFKIVSVAGNAPAVYVVAVLKVIVSVSLD